ncbi:hypothetical protein ACFV4T_01770 [Streptomyces sp. NPDC059755]
MPHRPPCLRAPAPAFMTWLVPAWMRVPSASVYGRASGYLSM